MEYFSNVLIENQALSDMTPWSVEYVFFDIPCITLPHYADTIEICRYHDVTGTACIGSHTTALSNDAVLYIPPDCVHSMNYEICAGYAEILKLKPDALFRYINIPALYSVHNRDMDHIPYILPKGISDDLAAAISAGSTPIFDVCAAILQFYQRAMACTPKEPGALYSNSRQGEVIREIIRWTEENYSSSITLEQVSQQFHYSRNYFCDRFRQETGVSYWDYLHNVRVFHACSMLRSGLSVSQVSERCGYTSVSYFIQLFKKITRLTPKQYVEQINCMNENHN